MLFRSVRAYSFQSLFCASMEKPSFSCSFEETRTYAIASREGGGVAGLLECRRCIPAIVEDEDARAKDTRESIRVPIHFSAPQHPTHQPPNRERRVTSTYEAEKWTFTASVLSAADAHDLVRTGL